MCLKLNSAFADLFPASEEAQISALLHAAFCCLRNFLRLLARSLVCSGEKCGRNSAWHSPTAVRQELRKESGRTASDEVELGNFVFLYYARQVLLNAHPKWSEQVKSVVHNYYGSYLSPRIMSDCECVGQTACNFLEQPRSTKIPFKSLNYPIMPRNRNFSLGTRNLHS